MAMRNTPAWIRLIAKRRILPNGCYEWTGSTTTSRRQAHE